MKLVIYTFRTFPFIEELRRLDKDFLIIGNIKDGLELLYKKIKIHNPDFIVGFAKSSRSYSQFEMITINQFNKNKKVIKDSNIDQLTLYTPDKNLFAINSKPSDSFCNYTMFKISHFLEKEKIGAKHSFIHINSSDISSIFETFN